jgi:hypothetical protein
VLVITEKDTWNSWRIGTAAEMMLYDRWKLSGDIAYVPYTAFTGTDDHVLRKIVFEGSGHGRGVQAEAFLSYLFTSQFSVGVGGRYWGMWTTSASDTAIVNGVAHLQNRNDTDRTERLGALFQGSYKFDTK